MNITEEAVEAAADYLPHARDCQSRPERDCQCLHLRLDIMRTALGAAIPHLKNTVTTTKFAVEFDA